MKSLKPLLSTAALLLSPMLASATPVVYSLLDGNGNPFVQVNEPNYLGTSGTAIGDQIHVCNLPISNLVCTGVFFSQEVNAYGPTNYNPFTGVYVAVYSVNAQTYDPSGYDEEFYVPRASLNTPGSYQSVYASGGTGGPILTIAPAPEPSTFASATLALIGLGCLARRRRHQRERVLNSPLG